MDATARKKALTDLEGILAQIVHNANAMNEKGTKYNIKPLTDASMILVTCADGLRTACANLYSYDLVRRTKARETK